MADRAPDPLAPETPVPPRIAGQAPRWLRGTFAALALAFLLVPPVLAIARVSGGPLERERAAPAPSLGDGWAAFDQAADYVTQKLPFRAQGVDANTWIADNVWGRAPDYGKGGPSKALPFEGVQATTTGGYNRTGGATGGNPVVSTGPNGWYFLQAEISTLCQPPISVDEAISRWTSLVRSVRASGRKVVLLIVPEKSTVYPEQMAKDAPAWDCARANKLRLWSELADQSDPDIVPLLAPLLALKKRDPSHLVYLRLNTHWNSTAAILLPKLALQRLGGPVQVRPEDLTERRKHFGSDLGAFAGHPHAGDYGSKYVVHRPGDAGLRHHGGPLSPITFTHPGDARTVLQGRTLFLGDSFGDPEIETFPKYAAHLVFAQWVQTDADKLAQLINNANTVIIETVERDFFNRAAQPGREGARLTPDFLSSLPKRLGPPPR
jgi:alginate O-acetyltransferase complex protein AlgJ